MDSKASQTGSDSLEAPITQWEDGTVRLKTNLRHYKTRFQLKRCRFNVGGNGRDADGRHSPAGPLLPCEDPASSQSVSGCHSCGSYRETPGPDGKQTHPSASGDRRGARRLQKDGAYRAELDASDAVAQLVQGRRPAHDTHHIRNDQQDPAGDTRFSRQPDLEESSRRPSEESDMFVSGGAARV